jgi:hypothetical protein
MQWSSKASIGRERREPCVFDRAAGGEVIEALPGLPAQAEQAVHLVTKKQPIPVARIPAASASRYSTCPIIPHSQ